MNAFEYAIADSFPSAAAFLAERKPGEALVKAGGIDVLDRLKERIEAPRVVLSLHPVARPSPPVASDADGTIVIHALTRLAELAADPLVRERLPALADAADEAATPQVRNMATVGGNLCQKPRCWYFRSQDFTCLKKGGSTCYAVEGDNRYHAIFGAGACHIVHPSNLAIPLLAYNAQLVLVKQADGKLAERTVAADEFFRVPTDPTNDEHTLAPGELIREIRIAKADAGLHSAYVEIGHKQSYDWALAACAVNLNDPGKPRVVLGHVAPIPWRLPAVEKLLANQSLSDPLVAKCKEMALAGAKPMRRNGYKTQLVGAALERALRAAAGAA
ncbi:MAG: xanthine dehydrogenase family protein subunit M [Phycisphaerae bacterium]